jgi:Tol biopolymer transport system component
LDPIAFIFHPEAEARRRAEAYAKRSTAAVPRGHGNPAVVHLNSFHDYLEEVFGNRPDDGFAGQLSLLNPRSRRVTVIGATRKGAIPLAWSPDRDRLLFAQWDLGTLRLIAVVATWEGSTEGRASRSRLVSRIAALGPGEAVESISPGPTDGEPACSPDGTAFAYVRIFPDERSEIWIHSFADEAPARAIAQGREPSFSPDGEWIVYSHVVGKTPALWRIRRDGTGRSRLGRGSGADEYGPAVSPDGSLVVYESVFRNRNRLFVRRFDGTGDSVLFSDGDGTHAVW